VAEIFAIFRRDVNVALLLRRDGGAGLERRGRAAPCRSIGRQRRIAGGDKEVVLNLFELPLLLYVLMALPLRHADLVIVMLSWVFVVTCFASNFATSNDERPARWRGLRACW
jgi:hypothetical protein